MVPDHEIPNDASGDIEKERLCGPICIDAGRSNGIYGTRTQTVILVKWTDDKQHVRFIESTLHPKKSEKEYIFPLIKK